MQFKLFSSINEMNKLMYEQKSQEGTYICIRCLQGVDFYDSSSYHGEFVMCNRCIENLAKASNRSFGKMHIQLYRRK